jgi:hypothetical protein
MKDISLLTPSSVSLSKYATDILNNPHWVICEDYVHKLGGDLNEFYIHIPEGYLFTKWNLPSVITNLLGDEHIGALVVLNYMKEHRLMRYNTRTITMSIETIEATFLKLLKQMKVSLYKRVLVKLLLPLYRAELNDKGYKIRKQAVSFFLKEYKKMNGYFK